MFRRVLYAASAVCLVAAKQVPAGDALLEKSLLAAGGYSKYQRLETVSLEFVAKSFVPASPAPRTGRLLLKFHDAGGLRIREEAASSSGRTLTLVTPEGVRQWRDGAPVSDAAALDLERRRLVAEAFWLLSPHMIKESGCAVAYGGMGYLGGKLTQRLEVSSGKNALPVEGRFTAYLDTGSQRLDGVAYVPAEGAPSVTDVFGSHIEKRGMVLALQRDRYDESYRKIESFSIINVALNDFVDDALFTAESP